MIKKAIKVILVTLAVLLLVFCLFFLILFFNQGRIKKAMLSEINTYLVVPVDISSVDISIRKFPDASFLFTDVYSRGANSAEGDTLLFAKEVFLQFNIWQVISSSISINEISIENGVLNISQSRKSGNNYEIWKKDSTTQSSSLFALDKLVLRNLRSSYTYNFDTEIEAQFFLDNADLRGEFKGEDYNFHGAAQLDWDSLLVDEKAYLHTLSTRTEFDLINESEKIYLKNATLTLDNDVVLDYAIAYSPEKLLIEARSDDIDLEDALILSANQKWYTPDKEMKAGGDVSLTFKYSSNNKEFGKLETGFITKNAQLENNTASISNIDLEGSYLMDKNTDQLVISKFSGEGRTGKVKGKLEMKNLTSPHVKLSLQSDLDLKEWLVIFPQKEIKNAGGETRINLNFENHFSNLDNIKSNELRSAKADGSIAFDDITMDLGKDNLEIRKLNGSLRFNNSDLAVERIYFKSGNSDIYLQGSFNNIFNYLLLEDENLKINARLKSQSMDLQDFILASTGDKKPDTETKKGDIDLNLIMEVGEVRYKTFYATDVKSNLSWSNNILRVNQFNLNSDGGSFEGNFEIDTRPAQKIDLTATLKVSRVNIHDLFISFNNFSQDAIAAENIYGTGSAVIKIQSSFTKALDVIMPSIDMQAHLKITDGNLKNYEPLTALSDFAEISELKDVKFSLLENDISIKDQQITIPEMEVKSNILDLEIYGTHNFDNAIEYHLKLKLKDVLYNNRKGKPGNSEFDEYIFEEKTDEDPRVPILITGTVDKPVISLDNKNLGKSLSDEMKEQGKEIKNIFKKEEPKPQKGTGIKYKWEEEDDGEN